MRQQFSKPQLAAFLFLPFAFLLLPCLSRAQTLAPDAPGKDAQWATAGKQAIGTANSPNSKVWFTLAQGVMTEVYYPNVTVANVHLLQFVVVNPQTKKVETEQNDAVHKVIYPFQERVLRKNPLLNNEPFTMNPPFSQIGEVPSLVFAQINTAKSGQWTIKKVYCTDPQSDTVLIKVSFEPKDKDLQLYVYYDPSLANTGRHDTAWTIEDKDNLNNTALVAQDGKTSSALMVYDEFEISVHPFYFGEITNGFLGTNDGLTQLQTKKSYETYNRAEDGNVVQFARIHNSEREVYKRYSVPYNFSLALSFAETPEKAVGKARKSLSKGFSTSVNEYEKGWSDYAKTLPQVEPKYQAQFNMAAMVLKASEDKTVGGANVASLTIPWGGGANANEDVGGGYHLVWARDLYQVVTAYMALGDAAAANRALDFLFDIQQKPDGSFPQNSWLDGRPSWNSLQLDEVAFPLILAYQLKRFDATTYQNHVKRAADFIVKTGPKTVQERWEEKLGYSPSTIAAEIAGLVCAAEIAKRNNDDTSADLYLKTADEWAANVEKWTATTKGKYGDGNYYLRLTENGTPDANEKTVLNNGAGTFQESEIVDAGFLELVRLGIKSPDDALIQKSINVVDQVLKVNTPNGEAFYRYNHDGYGEMDDGRRWNWDGKYTGKGRPWPLLSGERGEYELAEATLSDETFTNSALQRSYQSKRVEKNKESQILFGKAKSRLEAMANFANEGLMIPEQVWDSPNVPRTVDKQFIPELKFGEGTGSATPLAWSMAQFIRLAMNLKAGKNLETPDVVYNRYVLGKRNVAVNFDTKTKSANDVKISDIKTLQKQNANFSLSSARSKLMFDFENDCFFQWRANQSVLQQNDLAQSLTQSPIIWRCKNGNNLAIFVYRGDASKVQLTDDSTSWKPSEKAFENFSDDGKDKIFNIEFAPTARVEYKLIVDDKWINDPLNPNKVDNGVGGENSVLTMPDYKPTVWDKDRFANVDGFGLVPTIPNFDTIEINSKTYGKRVIKVYQPPNEKNQIPTLYLQDGTDYINRAKAIQIQGNLVRAGKIKPFIMVFLDYNDRMKDYWASDKYAEFVATEVVPEIDRRYRTVKNRDGRALLGASLGGVTSVWIALKHPAMFARVGGQSSAFWIDDERIIKELAKLDASKDKFKFYFDTGTLEGANDDRRAVEILRGKGYKVTYQEAETGHNWTAWRDRLADAFAALMN